MSKKYITEVGLPSSGRRLLADSQGLRSVDVHFFSSLYEALRKGGLVEFKPSIRQGVGVVYELFGIEVPEEKIKVYHERGLMEVAGEVSFPSCAICGTTCLYIALKCPQCFSRNIEKRELMIHYDCGHTGSVEEFVQTSPGIYRCPRCNKEMKRIGIDYGRPGLGFVCGDCKMIFQIPMVEVECENGHVNRIQQLEVKKYPVYRLSEEAKKLSQVFDAVETIANKLRTLRLDVATFARVRGLSGVTHSVPIYVKGDPSLVVEIAPEKIADELYPVVMTLKAADIPNSRMVIILPSSFKPELETVFNPEKIRVIKVEEMHESVDRVIDEIAKMVGAVGHADP